MPRLSTPRGLSVEVRSLADVIGNHTRTELLHRLSVGGPATATQLAARLEVHHASVHRHLRLLEQHGLVAADAPLGHRRGNKSLLWRAIPDAIAGLGTRWVAYAAGLAPVEDRA